MNIAQGLYEGIDLGSEGPEGLITYMRTDSVRVAPEAIAEARAIISKINMDKNLFLLMPSIIPLKKVLKMLTKRFDLPSLNTSA